METQIFDMIRSGTVVLTPNQRLAAYLRHTYDETQMHAGETSWTSPDILPLSAWLKLTSNTVLSDGHVVLSSLQARQSWETIIQQSTFGNALLRVSATAKLAQETWSVLQQWSLPLSKLRDDKQQDIAAFYSWAKQYQKLCRDNHWIDEACLALLLQNEVSEKNIAFKQPIVFFGFDQLTPAIESLITTMKKNGCIVTHHDGKTGAHDREGALGETECDSVNTSTHHIGLHDQRDELVTMARWAKQHWMLNGEGRVACIVPNLASIRSDVSRIFQRVFSPNSLLKDFHELDLPFNISGGEALSQTPIISAALKMLSLGNHPIEITQSSELLRSPFISGGETEMLTRASLDRLLRCKGEHKLSLRSIIAYASDTSSTAHCPKLVSALTQTLSACKSQNKPRNPSEWVKTIYQQLQAIGWPGERNLTSTEYQQVTRWQQLLEEFSMLDVVCPPLSFSEALQTITRMAKESLFQVKVEEKPIQVLGLLEAAGLPFDHIWIMGLSDNTWPPPAKPNPFIPIALQRKHDMPHASAERETQFCDLLMQRFKKSTTSLHLSYPKHEDDKPLNPSAFIKETHEIHVQDLLLAPYESFEHQLMNTVKHEVIDDSTAPTVSPEEKIKGGTWIFKQQAACAFRAFSEVRLGATALGSPQPGLDAAERGSLLHAALEQLWNSIGSHHELVLLSDEGLNAMISDSINAAVHSLLSHRPLTLKPQFLKIEKMRLEKILHQWLALEKKRPPFSVVEKEQWHTATISGITLQMRVDRMDAVEGHGNIIIDYKTGFTSIQDWFGDRPEEPQLPLYCVTSELPIDGVVFAQVRAGDMRYKGIMQSADMLPGITTLEKIKGERPANNWPDLLNTWKTVLENLAEKFAQGEAAVDPKDPKTTCQYCNLHSLCRIYEN